jgi:hypothetical protein
VKSSIVCFIGLISILAYGAGAQTATFSQQFYGTWYTYPRGNPTTDPIRHEFRHNATTGKDEMIVTRFCPGDYRTVAAKAISPIEISESTIRVLKSASDTQEGEGRSLCRASIDEGVLNYTFSEDGSRITVTNPGGNPDIVELARQDAASESMLQSRVYGSWLLPAEEGKEVRVETRLIFYSGADPNKGGVRQVVSCSKGKDSLLSQVDSAISITKDEITIIESASHEERNGPFVCAATITAATLHYGISLDGSIMTLSKAGQKPLVLTRER